MMSAVPAYLLLFTMFYGLGIRHRRTRTDHKRYMLLASTGGLGAGAFRVLAQVMEFGPAAGIAGIVVPNLIVVAHCPIAPLPHWLIPIAGVTCPHDCS